MDAMESSFNARILIIDDDPPVCKILKTIVQNLGHTAVYVHTLKEGLGIVDSQAWDVVLLDVNLPDGIGLRAIEEIQACASNPDVIIITGQGDPDGAKIAISGGAWDYIQKDDSHYRIKLSLQRALQYRQQRLLIRRTATPIKLGGIVGNSAPMKKCYELLAKAADSAAPVLIHGETGTGKELYARAIHENSRRAPKNMVVVDCAALPETLVESLLFGHEKGSYTGADRARHGLVAQADQGTLFLDEVGELPLATQKVFLRVLQEKRFRSVGGQRERTSDFRLITATNRNLPRMAADHRFREDLLYRIGTIQITLPPLRERNDDIRLLTHHFVDKICERYRMSTKSLSPDFMECLLYYPWPGNVRELINTLETVITHYPLEKMLYGRHLPEEIRISAIQRSLDAQDQAFSRHTPVPASPGGTGTLPPLKDFRRTAASQAERDYMLTLVNASKKDVKKALRISGLSRSRYYELLRKYDLLGGEE
jgi:two-component system NtrC family response regulator